MAYRITPPPSPSIAIKTSVDVSASKHAADGCEHNAFESGIVWMRIVTQKQTASRLNRELTVTDANEVRKKDDGKEETTEMVFSRDQSGDVLSATKKLPYTVEEQILREHIHKDDEALKVAQEQKVHRHMNRVEHTFSGKLQTWREQVAALEVYSKTRFSPEDLSVRDIRQQLEQVEKRFEQEVDPTIKENMCTALKTIVFTPHLKNIYDEEEGLCSLWRRLQELNQPNVGADVGNPSKSDAELRLRKMLQKLEAVTDDETSSVNVIHLLNSAFQVFEEQDVPKNLIFQYLPRYQKALKRLAEKLDISWHLVEDRQNKQLLWRLADELVKKLSATTLNSERVYSEAPSDKGEMVQWLRLHVLPLVDDHRKFLYLCYREQLSRLLRTPDKDIEKEPMTLFLESISGFNEKLKEAQEHLKALGFSINMDAKSVRKLRKEQQQALEYLALDLSWSEDIFNIFMPSDVLCIKPKDIADCISFDLLEMRKKQYASHLVKRETKFEFDNYVPAVKLYQFSKLWFNDEEAMASIVRRTCQTLSLKSEEEPQTKGFFAKAKNIWGTVTSKIKKSKSSKPSAEVDEKGSQPQGASVTTLSIYQQRSVMGSASVQVSESGEVELCTGHIIAPLPIPFLQDNVSSDLQAQRELSKCLTAFSTPSPLKRSQSLREPRKHRGRKL